LIFDSSNEAKIDKKLAGGKEGGERKGGGKEKETDRGVIICDISNGRKWTKLDEMKWNQYPNFVNDPQRELSNMFHFVFNEIEQKYVCASVLAKNNDKTR